MNSNLAGERTRWEASIETFDDEYLRLPGDCVVAAAFMSYAGPFPSEYRELLVRDTWLAQVSWVCRTALALATRGEAP
jgi:dynein heavy chain